MGPYKLPNDVDQLCDPGLDEIPFKTFNLIPRFVIDHNTDTGEKRTIDDATDAGVNVCASYYQKIFLPDHDLLLSAMVRTQFLSEQVVKFFKLDHAKAYKCWPTDYNGLLASVLILKHPVSKKLELYNLIQHL